MSLKSRKSKRDSAIQDAKVLRRDGKDRAILVAVPSLSEDGGLYSVTIGRTASGLHTRCTCGKQDCPGNSHHTVCYHSMAAVMLAAQETNGKVFWCGNEPDAKRLNNIHHGQIVQVNSLQGKGKAWVVFVK